MTPEKLRELQREMSNDQLIIEAKKQVRELARTGGKSHTMNVPPKITDTDMILSELIDRFSVCVGE